MNSSQAAPPPLVSIVTPAYNEEKYLAECIESVLSQTYSHWNYTIVNNCSKDRTLEIAREYAKRDPRIRVVDNTEFLDINANQNEAVRQVSPEAKYCKFVFGDDWLYPTCLEEMVRFAEDHPSVGLVAVYGTDGRNVLWTGLNGRVNEVEPPWKDQRMTGRDAARVKLMGGPYVFGSMTSLLVRADLMRKRKTFFNEQHLHADLEACYDVLRESDFGFVHQILSYHRARENSTGSWANDFDSIILGDFVTLLKYGPEFMNQAEYRDRCEAVQREYYRVLAKNVLRARNQKFWDYHRATLATFGVDVNRRLLMKSVIADVFSRIRHPGPALAGAWRWWSRLAARLFTQKPTVRGIAS